MTPVTQHGGLTAERWSRFSRDQQVLMIGNEMHRAAQLMPEGDRALRDAAYERVLRLTDLTIAAQSHRGLRRELLRWRDLVAALYIAPAADPFRHAEAFHALLLLTPVSARQIEHTLGSI
jgi:hypothetical protein